MNKINSKITLDEYGWDPNKTNVIIIHGFNGTEQQDRFMVILRNGNILKHFIEYMKFINEYISNNI